MRMLGFGLVVVAAIGAALWLRSDDAAVASDGARQAAQSATALLAPRGGAAPSPAHHAGDAIASTRREHIAQAMPARTGNAAARSGQRQGAPKHDAAPVGAGPEDARPAGELFLPFIANDPAQVFAPATVNFHAAVQSEPVDPDWGPAATETLRNYIAFRFGERFEIPYVDCRQDLCELQVAGRIGADLRADTRDIQQAMGEMRQQAWWAALEFDQESGTVGSSPDGRVLVLWFFSRK